MRVFVNDTAYEIPFDPAIISMEDFISYHTDYGKDLNTKLKSILDKKYIGDNDTIELERNIALEGHLDEEALCWFAFWTKTDLDEVKQHPGITPFLERYRLLRTLLRDDDAEFPYYAEWNGDEWTIQDFKVNPASEMSFNEIITSKEVMRQIYSIGEDNWAALPYLCAVYFRKKDELFKDEFIQEGSERMEVLKKLPLKHGLAVAFFLKICVSIWSSISVSSARKAEAEASLS